jgi:hypothetical protein
VEFAPADGDGDAADESAVDPDLRAELLGELVDMVCAGVDKTQLVDTIDQARSVRTLTLTRTLTRTRTLTLTLTLTLT